MKRVILASALLTVALAPLPAEAQHGSLTRSFVSSTGLDTNSCMITAPCQTFAVAYTKIGANGIIAALDPGKYGPLTIIGPVTVNGNGWAAITATAQGNGITVTAGSSDIVTLNGLEIDGAGAGYNGIVFNSGGNFTVSNCVLGNFVSNNGVLSGIGILIDPSSGGTFTFDINNTVVTNSSSGGLLYFAPNSGSPNATFVVDHVAVKGDGTGMGFAISEVGSSTTIAISNSVVSNNTEYGIITDGPGTIIAIDNTLISSNGTSPSASIAFAGIKADSNTHVQLSRSTIVGNRYGVINLTSPNTFYSYGNNQINGNLTADVDTVDTGTNTPVKISTE
jgi:hypothetical protein